MLVRKFENTLLKWHTAFDRRPLVIRGARQVGKSYTVREYAKRHFRHLVEINLEQSSKLSSIFSSLDPDRICAELAVITGTPIIPGESLLFIDEVQQSKDAFLSLRYFYEKMPQLHVVAAGSLFDFLIEDERELRVPVGRVEYASMHPLTFSEFLLAMGEDTSKNYVDTLEFSTEIPESIHSKLLSLFSRYVSCGGMPAVVNAYKNSAADLRYRQLQADILRSYRDDFRKYRSRINTEKLEIAFETLSRHAAQDFSFSEMCPDFSIATTKNILNLFKKARIISYVRQSLGRGLPLGAQVKKERHKYLFLDVGLLNALGGFTPQSPQWNLDLANAGAVAEQVVGQELLAYSEEVLEPELFYWRRDKLGSDAEVDYLLPIDGIVLPLEVKAGTTGKLRSLRLFLQELRAPFGVRVSQHNLSFYDGVLSVPLYAISQIPSLCRQVLRTIKK